MEQSFHIVHYTYIGIRKRKANKLDKICNNLFIVKVT